MRHPRVAIATALAGIVATGGLAVAFADTTPAPVDAPFGAETWYEPNPTCQIPVEGCLPITLPALNPYGAGTLHVGVSAGIETARSYLELKPVDNAAAITGATLTIPLDTATPGNGSMSPGTAKVEVCIDIVGGITADEGEFDAPPATDCSNAAQLTYSATPTPQLSGDLAPLIPDLIQGYGFGTVALALLPNDATATDSWNAVFSSNDRTNPPTAPAKLSLTFGGAAASAGPSVAATARAAVGTPAAAVASVAPVTTPAAGRAPATTTPATSGGTLPAPPAEVGRTTAAVPAPVVSSGPTVAPAAATGSGGGDAAAPAEAAPAAFANPVTVGFRYPAVLLLPLVLIALGAAIARVMSRPMVAAPRR